MSQLDISSTRQFEGIGMGLYTLQQIAKIHHGVVHLDSNPKRTRITLNIACLSVMNNEELIAAITELKEIVKASNGS
jgi:signal transduction histidine kinase